MAVFTKHAHRHGMNRSIAFCKNSPWPLGADYHTPSFSHIGSANSGLKSWHEICRLISTKYPFVLWDPAVILVVDDDRELCEALAEFLSIHGHAVRCARNGREALRLLDRSATPPELIFSDLMMPVLDGWQFIAEVEKDPELAEVPVVIMSADRDVAQTAKEAGAVAFVRKPVEPQTLLRIVDHFGKGSSRQSEL